MSHFLKRICFYYYHLNNEMYFLTNKLITKLRYKVVALDNTEIIFLDQRKQIRSIKLGQIYRTKTDLWNYFRSMKQDMEKEVFHGTR